MDNSDIAVIIFGLIVLFLWIGYYKYNETKKKEFRRNNENLRRERIEKQQK